jgi:tRNA pseudouridine38-40 synthase
MRIALQFAYDGRNFHGYARQPTLTTVEGELIKSLIGHGFIEDTKEACFRSASRTDKGVSALGNVIAFTTKASKTRIFQTLKDLQPAILVYGIAQVPPNFYPRYAKLREYRYYLQHKDLDVEKILATAACFTGEQNFTNFTKVERFKDPVHDIKSIVFSEENSKILLDFYAQTFLWHQVRRIVAALEKIGRGELVKEQIVAALDNPYTKVDFGLAPPEPLFLKNIQYDFTFDHDPIQKRKVSVLEKDIVTSLFLK